MSHEYLFRTLSYRFRDRFSNVMISQYFETDNNMITQMADVELSTARQLSTSLNLYFIHNDKIS